MFSSITTTKSDPTTGREGSKKGRKSKQGSQETHTGGTKWDTRGQDKRPKKKRRIERDIRSKDREHPGKPVCIETWFPIPIPFFLSFLCCLFLVDYLLFVSLAASLSLISERMESVRRTSLKGNHDNKFYGQTNES